MRLKLWGLILLGLAAVLGLAALLYRIFGRIRACEKEYEYMITRSGRLPGSRRKKEDRREEKPVPAPKALPAEDSCAATEILPEDGYAATEALSSEAEDYAATAVLAEDEYAETAAMEE